MDRSRGAPFDDGEDVLEEMGKEFYDGMMGYPPEAPERSRHRSARHGPPEDPSEAALREFSDGLMGRSAPEPERPRHRPQPRPSELTKWQSERPRLPRRAAPDEDYDSGEYTRGRGRPGPDVDGALRVMFAALAEFLRRVALCIAGYIRWFAETNRNRMGPALLQHGVTLAIGVMLGILYVWMQ